MGAVHVTVTIRNPADPERTWDGLFLVDTGATDSMVPRPCLEAIGLQPRGQRTYELADGSELSLDITIAEIEFMGEITGGVIIYGEPDIEAAAGSDCPGVSGHRGRSDESDPEEATGGSAQGSRPQTADTGVLIAKC